MMPWQKLMYHLLTGAGFPAEVVVLRWGCSVWPKLQRLLRSGVWLAWPDGFTLELPTKRITADVRRRQQVTSTCRVHVTHSIPLDPKIWELWTSCSESSHVVSRCVRSSCWEKDFVFVHVYLYVYVYVFVYIFKCVYVYLYIHVNICTCICIYVYMYMYNNVHV